MLRRWRADGTQSLPVYAAMRACVRVAREKCRMRRGVCVAAEQAAESDVDWCRTERQTARQRTEDTRWPPSPNNRLRVNSNVSFTKYRVSPIFFYSRIPLASYFCLKEVRTRFHLTLDETTLRRQMQSASASTPALHWIHLSCASCA